MIEHIISLYDDDFKSLDWVEIYGGISRLYSRFTESGPEVFPVCWNTKPESSDDILLALVPDGKYKSILYFEHISDIQTSEYSMSGLKKSILYSTNVRAVAWINSPAIGLMHESTSFLLFPSVRKILTKRNVLPPDGNPLKNVIRVSPMIDSITLESKESTMQNVFNNYSYSGEMALQYPYDYFSVTFSVSWIISENCISELQIESPIDCIDLNNI